MAETIGTSTTSQKLTAEMLGTFVLVLFGCGSAVLSGDYVATGLTFGLAVMVMIYAVGRISGGHFNPAVSVGAAMGGRMAWGQVPLYVAAQLAGAIVAGGALFVLLHGFEGFDAEGNMGANAFGDKGSGYAMWAAFILELVLTAIFVFVILAVTDSRNEHPALAPLAIGLTLAAIHFVAIPATGTSVNPARSIGPALFSGSDSIIQLWLFILAPLVGAAVAGLAYPLVFGHGSDPIPGSGLNFNRPAAAAVPGYGAIDQYQQQWNQQDPNAAQPIQPVQVAQPVQPVQSVQPVAAAEPEWTAEEAIRQGWTWDPQTQQWREPAAGWQAPQQGWPAVDPGDSGTQIRPPQGQ